MLNGLFNRNKPAAPATSAPAPDPSKAPPLIEIAARTKNPEYAISLLLQGAQHDPDNTKILELLLQKGSELGISNKQLPETVKTNLKDLPKSPYFSAVLESAISPQKFPEAVKAAEKALELSTPENAVTLADRAAAIARRSDYPKKDLYVRLTDVFEKLSCFGKADEMVLKAISHDDSPNWELKARHKELSARHYNDTSGVKVSGPGGFKENLSGGDTQIKNQAAKPLDQAVQSELSQAWDRYNAEPQNTTHIENLTRLLVRLGSKERLEQALEILKPAMEAGQNSSFRKRAFEIEIKLLEENLRNLQQDPADRSEKKLVAIEHLEQEITAKKIDEFEKRVEEDSGRTTEPELILSSLYARAGRYPDAIRLCQQHINKATNAEEWAHILVDAMLSSGKLNEAGAFLKYVAPHSCSPAFVCTYGLRAASALLEKASLQPEYVHLADQAHELLSLVGAVRLDHPDLADAMAACEEFRKNRLA